MGGGPDDPVVPLWIEPSGASEDAPADRSASDSVAHDTSEVPVVTELDGASSQSPRPDKNDAVGIESHENTEVDDTEDEKVTVTGKEQESANVVATEVQTVKADKQNPPLDKETMIKQPETRLISQEQLEAEVSCIYAGLVIVESNCIEVDEGQMLAIDCPLDVTKYLLMIPDAKLILLQDGSMRPEEIVCNWYIKVQKDAKKEDKKPSTPESTKNSSATSQDSSTTPKEDSAHPPAHSDVSEKTDPQVGSPGDYFHAFRVALELRAEEHGWPEYEQLAAVNAAEIDEEDRKKVVDGKYLLHIGYNLVDQLLRDLETAKTKAEEKEAEAKRKADQEAAQAKAEGEPSRAKQNKQDSNPDPEATSNSMDETPDKSEAQGMLSNDTQQAAPKETSAEESKASLEEESFEEISPQEAGVASEKAGPKATIPQRAETTSQAAEEAFEKTAPIPKEADVASEKVDIASKGIAPEIASEKVAPEKVDPEKECPTQQPSELDANLSAQTQQASLVKADADADAALEAAATQQNPAVDAIALDEKTKSESEKKPEINLPIHIDLRPLNDKSQYRKVGREWWVLISGQWVPSLSSEQYAALVRLHRTCLHENSDLFFASQHPSASRALLGLPEKYAMPTRMWRHAIHSFLNLLRHRLPESREIMDWFIIMAYGMMSQLDEIIPRFRFTWIECKADLARYGMAIEYEDMNVRERWRGTAKEEYTRAVIDDPTVGRLYHYLAESVRAWSSSPEASFHANVSKLFYYTKSLVVKTPFFAARGSVLTVIKPIVDRNKKAAEKPASVPQTDQDHFLTAVVHLILASLEPETLRENGFKDIRKDHLQAVYAALEKIKVGGHVKTPRIRPSAQLGLLLCQLLLGIPLVDKRWSPMMAVWAPDLVTTEDRADSDAMANARGIHNATIELISTMVPYLMEDADTRGLGVWEFIYVILVFMRSLKTRPALLKWLGPAFHAEMIAPYLNMLLREDETRGRHAFESVSQSELVTICSPLNARTKLGKYGLSTEDNIRKYLWEQEEKRKAESAKKTATVGEVTAEEAMVTTEDTMITPEGIQTTAVETMATTEETTTNDTAHEMTRNTKTPGSEPLYANVLPEHFQLSGFFFAKEADPEPQEKSLENPTEDAVVVACPAAPEATPAAMQTAEEPAVEQAREVSLTDSETDSASGDGVPTDQESENEAADENLTSLAPKSQADREAVEALLAEVERKESKDKGARQQKTHTKEEDAEKTQQEDEQKVRESEEARLAEEERKEREAEEEEERKRKEAKEAEEAEVRRQEGLLRDPPLFPNGWLKKSKYNFDERQVCDYVQSFETCNDRSTQILRLAVHLSDDFFIFESDEEKRIWISVSGASSVPKPNPYKKMPEIVERDGGVRVVYVDPSSHAAEIEEEKKRLARVEDRRKEEEMRKEKEKNAEATTEMAAVFDEKAKADAEEQPAQPERPTDHVNAEEAPKAVNIPAGAPSTISEDGNNTAISANDMALRKAARAVKAITAVKKPSSTHDAEPTEAEAEETTLQLQDVNDSQDMKGSDAGPDANAAAASADDQAAATVLAEGPVTDPQASAKHFEDMLNKVQKVAKTANAIKGWRAPNRMPGANKDVDEDGWTHVRNESHEDAETEPTVQTAQVETRSMISRLFFGW